MLRVAEHFERTDTGRQRRGNEDAFFARSPLFAVADGMGGAQAGDSRLYRLRDGELERLTDDHSLVEELVRQGKLTPEEADEHPQRSIITRALGAEPGVEADSRTWPARADDVYLICSDGLTSMVPEAQVAQVIQAAPSLAAAGRTLIDAANDAGGRDNITVLPFRLEEVGGAAAPAQATAEHAVAPATPDA